MFKQNLNSGKNIFPLEEAKNDINNFNNSPFSQAQTLSSFKENQKHEEINISEFQEKNETKYSYNFTSFLIQNSNENIYSKNWNNCFDIVKLNLDKNISNSFINSFIGKKRKIQKEGLLFNNNKNGENIYNYLTSFKKADNTNQNLYNNKSAFIQKISSPKIKTIHKNKKIKYLKNKIIINEPNDSISILPTKKTIFKSINISKFNDNNNIINDINLEKKKKRKKAKISNK